MAKHTTEQALEFRNKILSRLPSLKTDGQCDIPNQRFWDYYRKNKDMFFAACIYVRKDDDRWQIYAGDFRDREQEARQEIETWIQKYTSECRECHQKCDIEHSLTKSNIHRYRFLCRSCGNTESSGLPHKYVEYCVSQGFRVFPRPYGDSSAYYRGRGWEWQQKHGRWVKVSIIYQPPPCLTCGKFLKSFDATNCVECGQSIFVDLPHKTAESTSYV